MIVPIPQLLTTLINQESSRPTSPGVRALADELLNRYGDAAQAILFYGSCLRTGDDSDGIVDLYLLVDSYRTAYRSRRQAFTNKLLPPNVFYLELPVRDRVVRTKYAVLTLKDFKRGTSLQWFHSYLWGRFAQPVGLIYARDSQVASQVRAALARAVITFMTRVLPQMTQHFTARDLWRQGLLLSYRAELRSERPQNLVHLFDHAVDYYEQLTRAAMASVPFAVEIVDRGDGFHYQADIPAQIRKRNRLAWGLRNIQGKMLSILRLSKAFFTFEGGLEYIQWKIERHSGVQIEWTPRLRKHSLLAVVVLGWRLYRRGGFR